jgi:hypothetical protein
MTGWFDEIFEEIENDIKHQTKEGYDASDLITLQGLLMMNYSNVGDRYYLSKITLEDSVNLRWAIQGIVKKISWALYHGNYKEMKWLEEFYKSYEDSL